MVLRVSGWLVLAACVMLAGAIDRPDPEAEARQHHFQAAASEFETSYDHNGNETQELQQIVAFWQTLREQPTADDAPGYGYCVEAAFEARDPIPVALTEEYLHWSFRLASHVGSGQHLPPEADGAFARLWVRGQHECNATDYYVLQELEDAVG